MTGKKDAFYSQVKQLSVLTTVPIILLAGPAVGFFLGSWIDRKANIYPWVTVILTALGFIASVREVFRLLKEIASEDEKEK